MADFYEKRRRELDEMEKRYRADLEKFWRDFQADKMKALAKWDETEARLKEQSDAALRQYTAGMAGARARLAEAEAAAERR
jgi:hypothetical protein